MSKSMIGMLVVGVVIGLLLLGADSNERQLKAQIANQQAQIQKLEQRNTITYEKYGEVISRLNDGQLSQLTWSMLNAGLRIDYNSFDDELSQLVEFHHKAQSLATVSDENDQLKQVIVALMHKVHLMQSVQDEFDKNHRP